MARKLNCSIIIEKLTLNCHYNREIDNDYMSVVYITSFSTDLYFILKYFISFKMKFRNSADAKPKSL